MRAISVPSAPLGLQSSSAWTALTGAHVSWSMGFEQRIKRARAIGHEKLPANRENVVFLTTGGDEGTTLEPRGHCTDRSTLSPHPGRMPRR